jgi:hypothetical protein
VHNGINVPAGHETIDTTDCDEPGSLILILTISKDPINWLGVIALNSSNAHRILSLQIFVIQNFE